MASYLGPARHLLQQPRTHRSLRATDRFRRGPPGVAVSPREDGPTHDWHPDGHRRIRRRVLSVVHAGPTRLPRPLGDPGPLLDPPPTNGPFQVPTARKFYGLVTTRQESWPPKPNPFTTMLLTLHSAGVEPSGTRNSTSGSRSVVPAVGTTTPLAIPQSPASRAVLLAAPPLLPDVTP